MKSYALPFSVRTVLPLLPLLLAACSAESALVGGECNDGYSAQHGVCVANASPGPGAGNAPSPSPAPVSTIQATEPGPTPGPTPSDGGAPSDSGASDSGTSDSGMSDSGTSDAGTSDAGPADAAPVDPPPVVIVTPPDPPPAVTCAEDELACNDVCTKVKTDGQNCGACGRICPSNICIDGVCQGATPGDIVVIGHDMTKADAFTTHAKVFKNAVHLPTTDPLRVLAFEQDAPADLVTRTRALTGSSLGSRTLTFGQAAPEALEDGNLYASWDVVLIDGVSAANASSYGTRWATALDTFTKKGGVLVALDSGDGDIPGFFAATSLVTLGTHQALPAGTQFVVSAPGDTVGAQLLSPYASFGPSVAFVGAPASTNDFAWVVKTADTNIVDAPTVVHKIAR
ncbi:MAG: hypothetical protein U0270_14385 [Labilithrix sp.]